LRDTCSDHLCWLAAKAVFEGIEVTTSQLASSPMESNIVRQDGWRGRLLPYVVRRLV
jgi:hypothetical protein